MEERTYIHRRISDFSRNMQTNRTLSSLSIGSTTASASSALKIDSRPAIVIEVGNRLTRYINFIVFCKHFFLKQNYKKKIL